MTDHQEQPTCEAKQYLQDQLDKQIATDPLDDILKWIEEKTHINKTHNDDYQLNNICTGKGMSITQQKAQ